MTSFACDFKAFNMIYWTPMAGKYVLVCSLLEKIWKNMENRLFFRAATAGLGKYRTGGYGRIGV